MLENAKPQRVAIYCRVSPSGDEPDSGGSIENQRHFGGKYVDLHELVVHDYYLDDQVSGTVEFDKRPQSSRLLKDAGDGCFDTVLVYRLDRFARRLKVLLDGVDQLTTLNVGLRSMTETFDSSTPSGRLFIHMIASFAEYERESILERTAMGRARALREGRWVGGITPFGYQSIGKRLAIDPAEAAVVTRIFRLYVNDGMGLIPISNLLNAEGIKTSYAKRDFQTKRYPDGDYQWNASTVARILKNAAYTGRYNRGLKEEGYYSIPVIVDQDVFDEAQRLLKDHFVDASRNARRLYLLRNIIKCYCGRAIVGDGRHKEARYYYLCPKGHFRARAEVLEMAMWEDLKAMGRDPRPAIDKIVEQLRAKTAASQDASGELATIEHELASKSQEQDKVIGLYRKGRITEAQLDAQLDALQTETVALYSRRDYLCRIQLEAQAEEAAMLTAEEVILRLNDVTAQIEEDLVSGDGERIDKAKRSQRATFRALIKSLVVKEDGGLGLVYRFGTTDSLSHLPTSDNQSVVLTLASSFTIMRISDLARLYGVAIRTARTWVRQGKMRSFRPYHGMEYVLVDSMPPERRCPDCGASLEAFPFHRQRCNPCREKRNRMKRHT